MAYEDLSGEFVKVSSPATHVLLVELARGPVNAFHEPFWTEYGRVFDEIGRRTDEVRAVVLASCLPGVFSAGLDFSALTSLSAFSTDPGRRALQIRAFIVAFQRAVAATERCAVPVIAAVHGVALGLAVDVVCACDVRYAAEDAVFSIKEVDVGLASDIGTLARLPKLAGNQSMVHELAYTAREFSAGEAQVMGLVSRVVEGGREGVVRAAVETARVVAGKSPVAVVGTKHVLVHARDHTVQESLEYVATWNSAMLQSADLTCALSAAKEKRKPAFPPLGKPPGAKL